MAPIPHAQPINGRDITFTPEDFERVRTLIHQAAGIALSDSKSEMVYSRLVRRIRTLGFSTFREYLDLIEQDSDADLLEGFVNALTTNLTAFFREDHHFPILAEHLRSLTGPARIWCAAASSGEEPYSIAITLLEALGKVPREACIVASDIDTGVLEQARAGVYPFDRVSKLSAERLKNYFLKGRGKSEGLVRVQAHVCDLVQFRQLNLTASNWSLEGPFDAIFCRNVMIYFDRPTQQAVLRRMLSLLKPDGLIFAGHSENFQNLSPELRYCGQTVYRRKASGTRATERRNMSENA